MQATLSNTELDVSSIHINSLILNGSSYLSTDNSSTWSNDVESIINSLTLTGGTDVDITKISDGHGNTTGFNITFGSSTTIPTDNSNWIKGAGDTTVEHVSSDPPTWRILHNGLSQSTGNSSQLQWYGINLADGHDTDNQSNRGAALRLTGYTDSGNGQNERSRGILFQCKNTGGGEASVGLFARRNGDTTQMHYSVHKNNSGTYSSSDSMDSDASIYAAAWFSGSDRRLKENITPIENTLEVINKLNILQYDKYNSMNIKESAKKREIGIIAQEVENLNEPLLTRCLTIPEREKDLYYVDYDSLHSIAIKSLQELNQEYKQYKETVFKKIEMLENKLNILENNL
tara:strand:+ start:302 stop:1336 length:1035 start_codon:yes stop_codon:yes gene_type:complete